jgi:hypothetical protein
MALKLRGSHTLGDFLNDTFSLVPRIWKFALPVSLAALVPGAVLFAAAMGSFASRIKAIFAQAGSIEGDPSIIFSGIAPLISLWALASLALFLGGAYQKAFVCAQAGAALEGRNPGLLELAASAFRRAWLRVAVQDAVVYALAGSIAFGIVGAIFFPFLFSKLGDIIKLKESAGPAIGLIVSFIAVYIGSILAAVAAVWWLRVKTAVSAPAAVLEGANSFAGLGRSLDLTRGRGWRIFGIMFIVSLVISFGLGILTGPITFVVIMPGYFSFLQESISGGTPSPESIVALFSSMSWAVGVTMLVSGLVKGTLWPSFLTLLHADLRIRAGELEPQADEASPSIEAQAGGASIG